MELSDKGFSIEAALAKGRELPEWYLDEPFLFPGDDFYLSAFDELTTCRHYGMEPGPIPWSSILEYGRFHELEPDVFVLFKAVVRQMDKAFLEWMKSKKDSAS